METDRRQTSRKEARSYSVFFFGQNLFYMFIYLYLSFYYTEVVLLPASAVAVIFLVARIWDAVNDPMMGVIVDRSHLKGGKFIPWIRISSCLLPLVCTAIFLIRADWPQGMKIGFAAVSYILFGMAYTINDAPAFALSTVMTDNVVERSTLMSNGRLFATLATVLTAVLVKPIANAIGWLGAAIVISIVGVAAMLPVCRHAKERVQPQAGQNLGLKTILTYIKSNRYLLTFLCAILIGSSLNLATSMGTYVAKYSLGNEDLVGLISVISMSPMLVVPLLLPKLMRKFDKKQILTVSLIINIVFSFLLYVAGPDNLIAFLVLSFGRCFGLGGYTTMSYMFVADCIEYGTYRTGTRAEGITFSLQTFCTKMSGAVAGAVPLMIFSATGLDASIPVAEQSASALQAVWITYTLVPVLGMAVVLGILLAAYRLCDADVQKMATLNHGGEISQADRAELDKKFGPQARG